FGPALAVTRACACARRFDPGLQGQSNNHRGTQRFAGEFELGVRSRKILHFISLIFIFLRQLVYVLLVCTALDPRSRAATPEISPARKCGEPMSRENEFPSGDGTRPPNTASPLRKDEVSQGNRSMAQSLLPYLTTTSA